MKKKKKSKNALVIVVLAVLCIVIFMLIKNENNNKNRMEQSIKDSSSSQKDDSLNNNDMNAVQTGESEDEKKEDNDKTESNNINNKNDLKEDKQTPENINYLDINNENKICSSFILGVFNNGKTLSTEQYLKVAYNALNNGYVPSNKTNYSEEEINNIVYSIFNIKLSENKSVDGLTYTNGIYTLKKNESEKIKLNNVQSDVAAGNTYVEFDVSNTRYIAKLGTNTVTGEIYIISIIED